MLQLGRINTLVIKSTHGHGTWLDGCQAGDILLAKRDVPKNSRPGDVVEVFVYADREGQLRATTRKPYATVGEFARLRVLSNAPSGTYLDWGLQKDLLVPKGEQQSGMEEGKSYIVFVFLDEKTNRIAASSKLDKFLNLVSPDYDEGQEVDLLIYGTTDLGHRVIVNNAHEGMIYTNEVFQKLFIGQRLKGYIQKIREDLKIDVRLQKPGYAGIDAVSQAILNTIRGNGGRITVTDKSAPEDIYAMFGVSKKSFKKAIGSLYKKRLVTIDTTCIRLTGKNAKW